MEKEFIRYASVGDRIVVRGHHAGEAIRECVGELGKLHPDYERAQVYATLALREAVAGVAEEIRLASQR